MLDVGAAGSMVYALIHMDFHTLRPISFDKDFYLSAQPVGLRRLFGSDSQPV